MTARIAQWTLDVQDVVLMAGFWSVALGYRPDLGDDRNAKLYPPADAAPGTATVWLQSGAPPHREKLRAHLDLRPAAGDVDAEVQRLIALGAFPVDVGQQPDDPFVVLADPEGNEFCVLRQEPRAV